MKEGRVVVSHTIEDGLGHSLKSFCAPSDPGANGIYVSASGETLALYGFLFPPLDSSTDTWMVDGWNFTLDAYITVFTAITLWDDPDLAPTDQSQHGPEVAQLNGPFVVDLHKGGPLTGQGGGGEHDAEATGDDRRPHPTPFPVVSARWKLTTPGKAAQGRRGGNALVSGGGER